MTGQEPVTGNCTLYARWERKGPVAWLPYTSTADWSSIDLGEGHTGEQTILLTVKPLEDKQDGIIFYTGRNARLEDWGHAPIAFRLNPDGYFDARNGEEYKMDNRIAYVAGKSYQVKIAADIAKKKYDVYITDESGKEQCLAKDYAFRTGAQEISDIGKLCARSGNGAAAGKFVIEKHEMQNGIQQEISYTITYDANGGQVIPQSQTVKEGEKPTLPEPEREGYEFKGWYTQAEGGSQVTAQTVVTGDCTIYAHWEKKEVTDPEKYCTITYDANGGKVTPQSQTVKEGEKLTLPEPEREGYEFKGWYTQAEGGSQVTAQTAVTGDCTIYAHWEKKVVVEPEKYYTITYDANGGKVTPQSQTVKEGSAIRLPMPTRSGYTFKGWYTAKSGGVKFADNTVAAEDTILYARWEKKAPKPLKKGERFNVGKFKYKVLSPSSGKKTGKAVVLGYAKSNKDKSLTVADIVTAPSGRGKFRVTEIASNAFKGNKRLATVKIGKYVASVGKSAFAKCKAIRTIKGGRGIKVIGASAFSQCTSLKTFTVGKNVTEIKEKAFYGCKKVSSLTIRSAKLKKIGSKAITGMKENAAIKVPAKKKAAYKKLFHAKTGYKKTMKIKS